VRPEAPKQEKKDRGQRGGGKSARRPKRWLRGRCRRGGLSCERPISPTASPFKTPSGLWCVCKHSICCLLCAKHWPWLPRGRPQLRQGAKGAARLVDHQTIKSKHHRTRKGRVAVYGGGKLRPLPSRRRSWFFIHGALCTVSTTGGSFKAWLSTQSSRSGLQYLFGE